MREAFENELLSYVFTIFLNFYEKNYFRNTIFKLAYHSLCYKN